MSVTKISMLVIIFVIMFVGYRFWSEAEVTTEPATTLDTQAREVVAARPEDRAAQVDPSPNSDDSLNLPDEPGCLTLNQVEALPEVLQDAERINSVAASGTGLSSYEHLDAATLQSFADQEDPAAMVIMGAMQVMRAYDMDESLAVDWLNGKHVIDDLLYGSAEPSPSASLALNDAAFWFYEAAARGKLFALQNYGRVKGRLFGGPVGLGWLNTQEYDALSADEKNALDPVHVYGQLVNDIAPALGEGFLGDALTSINPQSEQQLKIREQLLAEFEQNLVDAGLPPIEVAATASPSREALAARICASEQEAAQRLGL